MAERAAGTHWLVLMEEPEAFPSSQQQRKGQWCPGGVFSGIILADLHLSSLGWR